MKDDEIIKEEKDDTPLVTPKLLNVTRKRMRFEPEYDFSREDAYYKDHLDPRASPI